MWGEQHPARVTGCLWGEGGERKREREEGLLGQHCLHFDFHITGTIPQGSLEGILGRKYSLVT